jgi:enolase
MASRSRTTFKKRQKELARLDKARDKAAKRVQRKLQKQIGGGDSGDLDVIDSDMIDADGNDSGAAADSPQDDTLVHPATPSRETV